MTGSRFGTYSLFLAITVWGTLLGAIVYSHLVYFPVYLSALPDSSIVVNGPFGLHESKFWLLIHPLLILSMLAAVALNWKLRARRKLLLISLGIYFVVLVVSQLYFVPELIAFEKSPKSSLPPADWLARGTLWQRLSWIRGTVMYLGILPLLLALTKPADNAPRASG